MVLPDQGASITITFIFLRNIFCAWEPQYSWRSRWEAAGICPGYLANLNKRYNFLFISYPLGSSRTSTRRARNRLGAFGLCLYRLKWFLSFGAKKCYPPTDIQPPTTLLYVRIFTFVCKKFAILTESLNYITMLLIDFGHHTKFEIYITAWYWKFTISNTDKNYLVPRGQCRSTREIYSRHTWS